MPSATQRILLASVYLSAAALLFLPAVTAMAEETGSSAATAAEDRAAPMETPQASSAMRVWIDPETGKIRQPTEAERNAESEPNAKSGRFSVDGLLNKSAEGLVVIRRPDGSKFINLQGRFMHALVLTRSDDGTFVAQCVEGEHQVNEGARVTTDEAPVR